MLFDFSLLTCMSMAALGQALGHVGDMHDLCGISTANSAPDAQPSPLTSQISAPLADSQLPGYAAQNLQLLVLHLRAQHDGAYLVHSLHAWHLAWQLDEARAFPSCMRLLGRAGGCGRGPGVAALLAPVAVRLVGAGVALPQLGRVQQVLLGGIGFLLVCQLYVVVLDDHLRASLCWSGCRQPEKAWLRKDLPRPETGALVKGYRPTG